MVPTLAPRLVAILLLLLAVLRSPAWAQQQPLPGPIAPVNVTAARPAEDEAIERLLDQVVSVDLAETKLDGMLSFLRERKVEAVLDHKALEEAGIGSDTPLAPLKLANVSLRSALNLLLRPFDLVPVIRDSKLVITTTDVASNELVVKVYRVDDLVRAKNAEGREVDNYDALLEVITSMVRPDSWDEVGGPGSVGAFQGMLVISQTERDHDEIQGLLAALREGRAKQDAGAAPEPIWAVRAAEAAARRKFAEASKTAADFKFSEETLGKAVSAIAGRFGVQLVLDSKALDEAGIGEDTPVTADLRQVNLSDALDLLLRPYDLTYVIANEVVLITTTDVSANVLSSVVYPVADLVQLGPPKVGAAGQDFNSLIELITSNIKPDSWDEVGGPANTQPLSSVSALVVSQTQDVQQEVERLLAALRKLRSPLAAPQAADKSRTGQQQALAGGGDKMMLRFYPLVPGVKGSLVVDALRGIAPESWEKQGAKIQFAKRMLTDSNTLPVQMQVQKFLIESNAVNLTDGPMRPAMGAGMGGGMGGMGGGMF
jgi:hypothetical protein